VEEELVAREEARRVRSALAALPETQRETITLAYLEGATQSQIGARMGVPLGIVKGRLRLALGRLQRQLEEAACG
jgi:RNA polymerase sigma-70 factor (ECF subfamily)